MNVIIYKTKSASGHHHPHPLYHEGSAAGLCARAESRSDLPFRELRILPEAFLSHRKFYGISYETKKSRLISGFKVETVGVEPMTS